MTPRVKSFGRFFCRFLAAGRGDVRRRSYLPNGLMPALAY
jgi:hypothetical protein